MRSTQHCCQRPPPIEQPDVKEKLLAQDYQPAPTTPLEHDKILREQIQTFGEVVKRLGLKSN